MAITIGYTVSDTIIMLLNRDNPNHAPLETKLMLFHHVVVLYVYDALLLDAELHQQVGYMPLMFELFEVTNPFLHFRWYLVRSGQAESALCFATDMLFFVLFLVFRGALSIWLLLNPVSGFARSHSHKGLFRALPLLLAVGLLFLNLFWCTLALRKAYRKLIAKNDSEAATPFQGSQGPTGAAKTKDGDKSQ